MSSLAQQPEIVIDVIATRLNFLQAMRLARTCKHFHSLFSVNPVRLVDFWTGVLDRLASMADDWGRANKGLACLPMLLAELRVRSTATMQRSLPLLEDDDLMLRSWFKVLALGVSSDDEIVRALVHLPQRRVVLVRGAPQSQSSVDGDELHLVNRCIDAIERSGKELAGVSVVDFLPPAQLNDAVHVVLPRALLQANPRGPCVIFATDDVIEQVSPEQHARLRRFLSRETRYGASRRFLSRAGFSACVERCQFRESVMQTLAWRVYDMTPTPPPPSSTTVFFTTTRGGTANPGVWFAGPGAP
jgi:hypothetical protein